VLDDLLRADTVDRFNAYKTAIEAGFLTVDEVRMMEDLTDATTPDLQEQTNG